MELFGKNIRIIPLVTTEDETSTSKIVLVFSDGETYGENYKNPDDEILTLLVYVYTPYKEWLITGD